ncbi:MAG: Secretion system C-terminal sorting domain [Bacteroidota bacterium]|jgi:hypothetical protein
MKKLILFILTLTVGQVKCYAQLFPFSDDYESAPAFNVPPNYTGDITVYLTHGVNAGKSLAAYMNSFNSKDSILSPIIGPITTQSSLSFSFRTGMVVAGQYPVGAPNFTNDDALQIWIAENNGAFQLIQTYDNSNYVPTANFTNATIPLNGNTAGSNIQIKFVVKRGISSDEYFLDIDNLVVSDPTATHAHDLSSVSIYPNPFTDFIILQNTNINNPITQISIVDIIGKVVVSKQVDLSTNKLYIDTRSLKKGIYYLSYTVGTSTKKYKIVKY